MSEYKQNKKSLFAFYKEDGKWKNKINTKFTFYMFQTHGFPLELTLEEINNYTPLQMEMARINSWRTFVKDNNIDTSPMTKEWIAREKEVMPLLNKVAKVFAKQANSA